MRVEGAINIQGLFEILKAESKTALLPKKKTYKRAPLS